MMNFSMAQRECSLNFLYADDEIEQFDLVSSWKNLAIKDSLMMHLIKNCPCHEHSCEHVIHGVLKDNEFKTSLIGIQKRFPSLK